MIINYKNNISLREYEKFIFHIASLGTLTFCQAYNFLVLSLNLEKNKAEMRNEGLFWFIFFKTVLRTVFFKHLVFSKNCSLFS